MPVEQPKFGKEIKSKGETELQFQSRDKSDMKYGDGERKTTLLSLSMEEEIEWKLIFLWVIPWVMVVCFSGFSRRDSWGLSCLVSAEPAIDWIAEWFEFTPGKRLNEQNNRLFCISFHTEWRRNFLNLFEMISQFLGAQINRTKIKTIWFRFWTFKF